MDKNFNELFDDFFNKKPKETPNVEPMPPINPFKNDIQKMIDVLSKISNSMDNLNNIDESVEEQIDSSLGKPDKIEFYNEGDMFFEKRTWFTENGELVKLIVTDEPTLKVPNVSQPTKTLKEELEEAVAEEKFEKAAEIRDRMKKSVKKAPRKRKTDK